MDQETIHQSIRNGVAFHRAGRLKDAEQAYQQVLADAPNHADALHLLGLVASENGRMPEALALIERAIQINPANPLYVSNLGVVYRNHGQCDRAILAFRRALRMRPNYPEACNHLGNALRDAGQLKEAVEAYQQALTLKPDFGMVHSNLGCALRDMGELDQAVAAFREAIRLQPGYLAAHRNLANALKDQGDREGAMQCLQRAVLLTTDSGDSRCPGGAMQCLQRAVLLAPHDHSVHSSLIFAMTHDPSFDEAAIHRESRSWALRHTASFSPPGSHSNDISPDRRLKVAYLSKYFCDSAEIHYLLPLFANHDRARFEVSIYSDVVRSDEYTARLEKLAEHWHSTVGLSDAQVAAMIVDHRIDIVVLIGHHSTDHRLLVMARKPAPLQLTWLFSAASTGLDAIDYRVTDPHIDPIGSDDTCYSERSLHLPETAWCYDPLIRDVAVNPSPAFTTGHVTFGSFNRIWKTNDAVFTTWSNVMRAVAGSRLFLLALQGVAHQRILDVFAGLDVHPDRISFVSRQLRRQYLKNYHHVDIALDTFPYNGHTTSLDALWMGVPVVTMAHRRPVGRVGASLLNNLGLGEFVANTAEEFVATATRLARDRAGLVTLRASLRQRLERSPLMDASRFARHMESAYLHIWREAPKNTL